MIASGGSRALPVEFNTFGRKGKISMPAVVFFAAVLVAASSFVTQVESEEVPLDPQMERIQRGLVENAAELLERYGTTFYAIGIYLTADGELREVVPLSSAPLEPALVADGLRSAVRELDTAEASVVGIAQAARGRSLKGRAQGSSGCRREGEEAGTEV